ncbi:uncharacterized protein LOC110270716 [Arachis ipaensis]|uniref:uncharacterized protein LOC110270716 n=1 Tax=Arachis ipaensis TaxID=130454 RepID=UPI000A2AFB4B|nr:uncharacterized protein LOC110270716 [Arachis ipaensis]
MHEEEPDVREEEGERSEAEMVPITAVYLRHCRTAAPRCLTGASVTVAGDLWLPENTTGVAVEGGRSRAAILAARSSLVATGNTARDAATWLSHFFLVAPPSGSRGGRKSRWVSPYLASAASVAGNSR